MLRCIKGFLRSPVALQPDRGAREEMKWLRVAAVTRATKHGVGCPVLEEFVKDLIQELVESNRVVGKKEAHEHQILELMGEWSHEYRKLAREVESLKLAREASLVEQDLSNDLERRRCEEVASSKGKADDGWEVDSAVKVTSNMSSSTCVEFNESPPPAPRHGLVQSFRRGPTTEGVRWP